MKLGIVGLPNVGKSTLFNALTKAGAESANYPFCTIDPNVGVVTVPDERLPYLRDLYQSEKVLPAVIEFVDIAGLVRGASKGEGLGNQFLSHIREVDAIVHVVRCFEDENVVHVEGSVDPIRDIETINLELIFSDLDVLERRLQKAQKGGKSGDKALQAEAALLTRLQKHLEDGQCARLFTPDNEEEAAILAAEADKEAAIRRAAGEAEAIKQVAEAKAQEIAMVYEAMMNSNPNEKLVQLRSLETLKEVANGEANKVFIPFEATATLSSLGAIKEVMDDSKKKK